MISNTSIFTELEQWRETHGLDPTPGEAFDVAIEKRVVAEYEHGEIDLEELSDAVEEIDDTLRARTAVRSARTSASEPAAVPVDHRLEALASIFRNEARNDPWVEAFRSEHLPDGLLTDDQVETWITETAEQDGPATPWVTKPEDLPTDEASRVPEFRDFVVEVPYLAPSTSLGAQRRRRRFPVRLGGVLDELRSLAEELSARYDWHPAEATTFILTDQAPHPERIRWKKLEPWPWTRARRRIIIEARLDATPDEIAALYTRLRAEMLGNEPQPRRSFQQKAADLAVFAAEHAEGHTWGDAMRIWNRTHPQHHYTGRSQFTRDARAAYQRVTGRDLNWKGTAATTNTKEP